MNILVFSTLWPNSEQPHFGIFVRNRILALARRPGLTIRVVAPVPYFPSWMRGALIPEHWQRMARIPEIELLDGLPVFHPRYFNPPKLGMSWYSRWMAAGARLLVERLHAENPIDLIDAHYVYPDGAAAVRLGAALRIPVFITARGTDINHFTRMPFIRPLIRSALQSAAGVMAVSRDLRDQIVELGIGHDRLAVIANGVDGRLFYPRDQNKSRRMLGLDLAGRILLTVASLVPLKRIDLLIKAFSLMGRDDARLFVIGDGPLRERFENLIRENSLTDRVRLIGSRNQAELAEWYSAADLFCLTSSREGSPNVVSEALACGLPVIATDTGGVRDLIGGADSCRLVSTDITPEDLAVEISQALKALPDRRAIAASGRRSWDDAAQEILTFYASCRITSSAPMDRKANENG